MRNLSLGRAVFLLMAVFLSGAAVGGFGVSLYSTRTVSAAPAWRQKYVKDLTQRLQLSNDQLGKLNTILDDTRARYDAVKLRYKPEMDKIHDEQVANIRAMLDQQQGLEYDKYREERERERRKAQQQQTSSAK